MNEEISDSSDKQSSRRQNYILTGVVTMIYSFLVMYIETNGELSRYYEPFEKFGIQCVALLIVSIGTASLFYLVLYRKTGRFSEILFNTTLIWAGFLLISSYIKDIYVL
tara:strand:- start:510 stop:836 length:327 start_codon:yes stop_codon:yes gene_type:complete